MLLHSTNLFQSIPCAERKPRTPMSSGLCLDVPQCSPRLENNSSASHRKCERAKQRRRSQARSSGERIICPPRSREERSTESRREMVTTTVRMMRARGGWWREIVRGDHARGALLRLAVPSPVFGRAVGARSRAWGACVVYVAEQRPHVKIDGSLCRSQIPHHPGTPHTAV